MKGIDFIGKRRIAFIFSLLLLGIGTVVVIIKEGPDYGIDFTGGTLLHLGFEKRISAEDLMKIRQTLHEGGIKGNIQLMGMKQKEIFIRSQEIELKGKIEERLKMLLGDEFPGFKLLKVEMIGPAIGKDMRNKAILAILFALVGMLVYIALRFEFGFALAAIIALFHDILITFLTLCIMDIEFDIPIVAALLTISGYSINDTIVIFDRIRENIKLLRKEVYPNLINISINQNLGRTIITSFTTLLAVGALYLLGGPVLHGFSVALIIGVLIGTYSSIFVASPLLIYWSARK